MQDSGQRNFHPLRIEKILMAPGQGCYYVEDVQALQRNSIASADRWRSAPVTEGFQAVREIAETLSIGLVLSDGFVAWGDAVAVSYGGKAGREKIFRRAEGTVEFNTYFDPKLKGQPVDCFREIAHLVDQGACHRALRYGLSQALLSACAWSHREMECQTIAREWDLPLARRPIPLQGSCGSDRYHGVDKMIVNQLDALPHSQIDDIPKQLGSQGESLLEYAAWIRDRIATLGSNGYRPSIHLDVHGAIAKIFEFDLSKVSEYLKQLQSVVSPYSLRVESVAVLDTFAAQEGWFLLLKNRLRENGIDVCLVMDEWANTENDVLRIAKSGAADWIHLKMPDMGGLHSTIEAALVCKQHGIGVLLGGSCVETDLSARLTMQVAMAIRPDAVLVKPGMGVNEGISICRNEMNRIIVRMGGTAGSRIS